MSAPIRSMIRSLTPALLAVAALTGSSIAAAQDGKLSVQASPQVLTTGQSTTVNVFAHFPPLSAYAFASARFDMHATSPLWTFATAGAVFAGDVSGINVGQQHIPQTGVFADPSNPYRVWRGTLKPMSAAPALVEVSADPDEFWVYPSKLTPSAAQRQVDGGSDLVFVNPLPVSGWVAAPARGTQVGVVDDVIVDGKIITAPNPTPILIGLLLPAVQKVRESVVGVQFEDRPDHFAAQVQVQNAQRTLVRQLAVTFDGQTTAGASQYIVGVEPLAPTTTVFEGFMGGVSVAAGDIGAAEPFPTLALESLPDVVETRVGPHVRVYSGVDRTLALSWTLCYDEPIAATVRDPQGPPRRVMIDKIKLVSVIPDSASSVQHTHNIRQLSLGAHTFEASGVDRMILEPLSPRANTPVAREQEAQNRR